ncbi:MAG: enoyl-CoA hydratase-related protein [Bdellovibrionota bacterium]
MNYESLKVSEEAGVVTAIIDRPEAMNALNANVIAGLTSLLNWLAQQTHVKALVITGSGEKAFVAGADIKSFEALDPAQAAKFASDGQNLLTRLERLSIPVIAAVNGFALGGGLELALACDFIYASENAKFGLPECTLGLMPGYGGTVRLPRRVGVGRAREMTFTGSMIGAQEALQIGLVNKIFPQAELVAKARETAALIGSRAPQAIAMIKKSIHEGASLGEVQANDLEARLFGELFSTEDKVEGVRAFVEKRKPSFKGR